MKERLQKLMAQANYGSRRACEAIIEAGRVRVNGQVAKVGDQADLATDTVLVDGVRLNPAQLKRIYIALNKPRNVVSTNVGHKGDQRRTVRDLVPIEGHLFTIGRLDADSEGLMILTNDGDLANKLSHPRYNHTRTYKVSVNGLPPEDIIARWEAGIMLDEDEGMTAPCSVRITKGGQDVTVLRIVMTEGKKRQIRRVAALLGFPVRRLLRTRIGMFEMGPLQPGEWREMTADEVRLMSTPSPELKGLKRAKHPPLRRNADVPPGADAARFGDRPRSTGRPGAGSSRPSGRPSRGRSSGPSRGNSSRPPRRERSNGGKRGR
jgi:pseudouridine synthase